MSRRDNWRALFGVLHLTKDMKINEIHNLVIKNNGKISKNTIRNWKTGRVNFPKHESMLTVLNALGYKFVIASRDMDNVILKEKAKIISFPNRRKA